MKKTLLLILLLAINRDEIKSQISVKPFARDSLAGIDTSRIWKDLLVFGRIHHLSVNELKIRYTTTLDQEAKGPDQWKSIAKAPINPHDLAVLTSPCNNVDFETGDFSGWTGFIGYNSASGSPLTVTSTGINTLGVNSPEPSCSYHTLVNGSAAADIWGGFPVLDPNGGNYAVRVGGDNINTHTRPNSCTGPAGISPSPGEILEQTFIVTPGNSLFTYKYAVVLNDGGHNPGEQPYFKIEVLDKAGNPIPCLQYYEEAINGTLPPGFVLSNYVNAADGSAVYYIPWTANSLNLSAYLNQTVTVRFTAAGCIFAEHFGYGYVDCSCSPVQITLDKPSTCMGGTITLTAPPGADAYQWSVIPAGPGITGSSTGASVVVNQNGIYEVKVTTGTCTYVIDTTITFQTFPILTTSISNVTCSGAKNGSASVSATGGSQPYTYSWNTNPSQSSMVATGLAPGTYSVFVNTPWGCLSSAMVNISEPLPLVATTAHTDVSCQGGTNGTASVTCSGGTPPYTYSWPATGANTATISNLSKGTYTVLLNDANGCSASQIVAVSEPALLNAQVSANPVSCNGGSDGTAAVIGTGGILPYTYSWSPTGGSTANAVGLIAGNYTAFITDANNCTTNQISAVTQPPALTTVISTTPAACHGGSTGSVNASTSGGTAPYTYSWTPGGAFSASVTGLTAGNCTVYIQDANKCAITQAVLLTEPSALTPAVSGTPVSCHGGSNGTASLVATGGTGAYTYSWNPGGGTTSTISNLMAGSYTVVLEDANHCQIQTNYTVTEPAMLGATATGTAVSCNGGNDGSAQVSVSGGTANYVYSWLSGGTGAAVTGLHTGPDTCFVTDQKGCKTKAGFNVTEPAALIITTSTSPSLCQGANGTASIGPVGGTLPYVYSWSPVAGSGSVLSNLIAGNYTCVVTDTKGCIASVVLVVNNATTAPKALISSAGPTTFCAGKSQVLTVSGGLSYSWSTGATAASITVNSPGLYWAWAFTTCGKDSASIQITVNPLPVPVIRGDTSMCTGVPVTLTASGGTGYSWSTSATTASCTVNTGGTYTVVVSNGCGSVSGSFTVTEHTIHAAFSTDATSGTIPFSVVLHDKSVPTPKNWSWNFGDNTNGLGPQTTHTFDVSGNYIILLTVTDSFGCTDTCTKAIEALEQPSWLEVPNVFTPNGDGDNDLFLVRSFGITYFHASIYDRWGLLLTELFAADQGWDGRTSAGGVCTDGTYYYLIQALGKDKKRYNLQGFMELLR